VSRERVYPVFLPLAGCPHTCLYCDQRQLAGTLISPQPQQVRSLLRGMLPARGDGEIAFFGGSFTLLDPQLQRAYLSVAGEFISSGQVSGVRISTRPDGLERRHLQLLVESGVTTVEVGCQSFCDPVLQRSGRGYDAATLQLGLGRLRDSGLRMGLQLMPGLPGGDFAEALASLHAALAWRPAFLRIYPALVLAGTGLQALMRRGEYHPLSLETGVEWCAELLMHAELAGVPVIRIGLHGEPGWVRGEPPWLDGPWHPAFGQLVRSCIWRRLLEARLPQSGGVNVGVPGRLLADLVGQRRQNLARLLEISPGLTIEADSQLQDHEFRVDQTRYDRLACIGQLLHEAHYVVHH